MKKLLYLFSSNYIINFKIKNHCCPIKKEAKLMASKIIVI